MRSLTSILKITFILFNNRGKKYELKLEDPTDPPTTIWAEDSTEQPTTFAEETESEFYYTVLTTVRTLVDEEEFSQTELSFTSDESLSTEKPSTSTTETLMIADDYTELDKVENTQVSMEGETSTQKSLSEILENFYVSDIYSSSTKQPYHITTMEVTEDTLEVKENTAISISSSAKQPYRTSTSVVTTEDSPEVKESTAFSIEVLQEKLFLLLDELGRKYNSNNTTLDKSNEKV